MLFQKRQSVVGIDIGTSYLKLAQVTHGQQPVLETYGIVNIARQIDAGATRSTIERTAEVLSNLMTEARVTTKRCIVSLPNSAVFTSVIDMPFISDAEMDSAIKYEAKKYIPLSLSEVVLSWSIVGGDDKVAKVLLIAVPAQVRESYISLFELANLQLEIIEIEALALIRSVAGLTHENSVIIDIGAQTTGLNVIKNGLLQLTRNLNVGGDTMTERLAQSLHITKLRAEQFKRDFGLSQSNFVPESIKPVLDVVKNEVKQVIAIYQSHSSSVDKVYLVGGGAKLPGIVEYFSDLGAPVVLGNALGSVAFRQAGEPLLRRFALQLPIAIGLAMRH